MPAMHEVDYKVFGDDMQYVEIELDPGEAAVRLVRPLDGCGGGVAGQHLVAAPAGQHHQVPLLPSADQPAVGEGVPEAVRMHPVDPRLPAAHLEHLADLVDGHRPAQPQQQLR